MPSQFQSFRFSLFKAEAELVAFKAWFMPRTFIGEKEIVSELRSRQQMCALLAPIGGIHVPDLIRFELALQGLF